MHKDVAKKLSLPQPFEYLYINAYTLVSLLGARAGIKNFDDFPSCSPIFTA